MAENKGKRVSVRQLATRTIKELEEEVAYFKENVPLLLKEIEILKCQVQTYEAIGTVEEFKALKEKKPKKAKSNKVIFSNDSYAYCPHCKGSIEAEFMKPRNCRKCGGELDWS